MKQTSRQLLRRYTELPFVASYLQTGNLALLSPDKWDDRNDAHSLDVYAKRKNLHAPYALCMSQAPETYHHWRVFSSGTSGACIQFKKREFLACARKVKGIAARSVKYRQIKDIEDGSLPVDDLPFLKRHAFKDEKELRVFTCRKKSNGSVISLPMPIEIVDRIILSPWLPRDIASHIAALLRTIGGCADLNIYRSTLLANDKWKKSLDSCA